MMCLKSTSGREGEKRGWVGWRWNRATVEWNWSSYLSSSWPYWTWRANQTSLLALLAFSVTCRSFSLLPQLHVPRTLGQPWRVLISVVWHAAIFFSFLLFDRFWKWWMSGLPLSLSLLSLQPLLSSTSPSLFPSSFFPRHTSIFFFIFIFIIIPIICIFFVVLSWSTNPSYNLF